MNKSLSLIILLFLAKTALAGTQLTNQNFDWYSESYTYISELVKSGNKRELVPVITTLGTIWKNRDGAIGSEIAEIIAEAMTYQPKMMFSWFNKYPVQLEKYNKRMPSNLFTNYSESTEFAPRLNKLKSIMEKNLFKFISNEKDTELVAAAISVLEVVRNSSIREID